MRKAVEVAKKLELTSVALGCLTAKELCAAFARVNPNTVMTLQNSYNWRSGRSTPRNFSLFEDWAAALGMSQGAHFIMLSSLDEFECALGDTVGGLLTSRDQARLKVTEIEGLAPWRNGAMLRGSFMAISLSWSPEQRGRLLGGALTLDVDSGGRVSASYLESVLGQPITFTGSGLEDGRTGQVALQCEATAATYLMSFHLPPPPGNLAAGVFAGNALYDPDSQPTAGTILFLRNHELAGDALEAACGYLDVDPAALARFLALLGYGRDPEMSAEQDLLALLTSVDAAPLVSMRRDNLSRAATLLDQRRLRAAGRP